jgi:REP element-mobilizing transposase RayT
MRGSCTRVYFNPFKVFGIAGGGIHQRKKRDFDCSNVRREAKELCRPAFLGRSDYLSTMGRVETIVRKYIQEQEIEDRRIEQLRITDEW